MHRNSHGSFDRASDIVAIPCDTLGNIGEYPGSEEEAASVFDMRILRRDKHDQTNNSRTVKPDHEESSGLELISRETASNTTKASDNVWRYTTNPS